jgi:hypothetical protein
MSIEPHVLQKVGVYEEAAGSFATSNASTPGDFLDFPYEEGSLQIDADQVLLDPMAGKIQMDAYDEQVLGPKKCTVGMKTTLHSFGYGTGLDGVEAVPTTSTWALLRVLKAILGGSFATTAPGAQTEVVSSTTTTVTVTAAHGARFAKGGVIGCVVVNGSSQIEAREIDSVSTDTVTVKEAFSAAPVVGSVVNGGVTVHPTSDPDTSLQLLVQGRELSDRFVFCGLQGGLTIEVPFGQATSLPKLGFSLTGPYWERLSDGGSVPTAPSYDFFEPVRAVDAELTVPSISSTSRVVVHQTEFKIELSGLTYEDVPSGAGVQGVRRKRRMPGRPLVRGSFTTPYEDSTWFDAFSNSSDRAVFQQIGNLPGRTVLLSVPTVQIGQPKRVAAGGVAGQMVPFMGRLDEAVDSPTTDAHYAAFRIHFL